MKEIKPVDLVTVPELVTKSLLEYILTNSLSVGDRLPSERKMAETLSVSRVSLKKAIDILRHYGILETRPQSGSYIKDLSEISKFSGDSSAKKNYSPNDMTEWRECRASVEPATCRLCAERITTQELAELEACLHKMIDSYNQGDMPAFVLEDFNFHYYCVRFTHNTSLFRMYREFCGDFYQWLVSCSEPFFYEIYDDSMAQHKAMFEAIQNHDSDRAEEISRKHNRMSLSAWRSFKP